MKFVQNNKILEDSNAENAERSAEKSKAEKDESERGGGNGNFARTERKG
jgi:hypothetical protein